MAMDDVSALRIATEGEEEAESEFDPASNPRSLRHCTQIRPSLFLGAESHADDAALLQRMGITHILACVGGRVETREDGISHLRVPMCDRGVSDLDDVFDEAFPYIAEAIGIPADPDNSPPSKPGNKILIHCKLGVNRSAAMTVGWLMAAERMTLRDAHDDVASKRDILMHDSYVEKLRVLDERLYGRHSTDPDELPCTSKVMHEAMAEVARDAAGRAESASATEAVAAGEEAGLDLSPVRDD